MARAVKVGVIAGKSVVVTGTIAGESRATAESKLRDAGAKVSGSVTKTTDLLICGGSVGASKVNKAEALGVQVVSWESVWNGGAAQAAPSGPPALAAVREVGPMLAKAGDVQTGPGWQHEIKWDGYRCIATVIDGRVAMQSRSGKSEFVEKFPAIAAELGETMPNCVVDGELVVLDQEGGDFAALGRAAGSGGGGGARFVVYDVLEFLGVDVRNRPLSQRRALLDGLFEFPGELVAPSPVFDDGRVLLAYCMDNGLEGIVSKRLDSAYREGVRDAVWTKTKCRCEQEFVVVGWTPGKGARVGMIGALVLAVNDDDGLILAGKCGCGDYAESDRMLRQLQQIEQACVVVKGTAAELREATREGTRWVRPEVVVQAEFQRWTEDGRLWHPSYRGQRIDKAPADATREPCAEAGR